MKVVGFNYFRREKKKKRFPFFCVTNFFKRSAIIMGILIFLMLLGIANTDFIVALKEAIGNFVSAFSQIAALLL